MEKGIKIVETTFQPFCLAPIYHYGPRSEPKCLYQWIGPMSLREEDLRKTLLKGQNQDCKIVVERTTKEYIHIY